MLKIWTCIVQVQWKMDHQSSQKFDMVDKHLESHLVLNWEVYVTFRLCQILKIFFHKIFYTKSFISKFDHPNIYSKLTQWLWYISIPTFSIHMNASNAKIGQITAVLVTSVLTRPSVWYEIVVLWQAKPNLKL
jgi:hypothetical protein